MAINHYKVESFDPQFSDGKPYRITVSVDDQGYHARFRECFLIYSETDAAGNIYQCKWEMISSVRPPWPAGAAAGTKVNMQIVLLAKSPRPTPRGCLGVLLKPLPRIWWLRILTLLGIIKAAVQPGNGNIYGSNDQEGNARAVAATATTGQDHHELESWLLKQGTTYNFSIPEV